MTAATASADQRYRGRLGVFARRARVLLLLAVATAGALLHARKPRSLPDRVVEDLVMDPNLRLDESLFEGDEWMKWCEQNLSAREFELMKLADSADRGRPVERVPAPC